MSFLFAENVSALVGWFRNKYVRPSKKTAFVYLVLITCQALCYVYKRLIVVLLDSATVLLESFPLFCPIFKLLTKSAMEVNFIR